MPPRPANRLFRVIAITIAALLLVAGVGATLLPYIYHRILVLNPTYAKAFADAAVPFFMHAAGIALIISAVVGLTAAGIALWPNPRGKIALTVSICCVYVGSAAWIYLADTTVDVVGDKQLVYHGTVPDLEDLVHLKMKWVLPGLAAGLIALGLHFLSTRRAVLASYGLIDDSSVDMNPEAMAHRLTHPIDPGKHKSIDFSLALHFLILVLLPLALLLHLGSDAYLIPGGGGGGGGGGADGQVKKAQATVKMVKKKPPTRRKKHFGRTNSAISLFFPSIDDSTVATDVAEITENTYQANVNDADAGGFAGEGQGGFGHGPGSGGGFGGGAAGGTIRFIRIQYDDPSWNDGNDESRADMNFLDEMRKVSHLKTADHSEAIPVGAIRNFKKGKAPPFLYFTGTGGAINLSPEDVHILRQYCLDGGMILADAGSEEWGRAFRSFIVTVFPERELLDISNDDPIFQQPFAFPGGAPPLWHHDGSRARGVKIDGRWAVFYFPGNLNDAWKTGHGGQPPAIVTQSMRLGMNIVWYSFVHYLDATKQFSQ